MKKLRLVLLVLFGVGLLLGLGLFLALVPRESRMNVAWLDFAAAAILYAGFWGKYSVLYRATDSFAANIPSTSMFWSAFSKCAFLSVLIMAAGAYFHAPFVLQLSLQVIALFLFAVSCVLGMIASRKVLEDDRVIQKRTETIGSIRWYADMAGVAVDALPPSHEAVRVAFSPVREEVQYLSACSHPDAQAAEAKILDALRGFKALCDAGAPSSECLAALRGLSADIALRRKMTNG